MSLRKTGIEVIGDVPWSTHFCQFYQTKQDLIDTIIPYIKNGLESNEFCMWVTADNLDHYEAEQALRAAIHDYQQYVERGAIVILPYTEWYLEGDEFDRHKVLDSWVVKLNQALAAGFEGARLTGDTMWLKKSHWQDFTDYEESINTVIGDHPLLVLCTYSLDKCGAGEVADVIANHEFAMIKRHGEWTVIENTTVKQAKQALQKAINELKTANEELRAIEDELRSEIKEREQAQDEIKRNEERLESLLRISQFRTGSIQELLDLALNEAITLTGSKFGYIYHYDETKKEFTLNTWSDEVMKQCSITEQQTVYQLEKTGMWGEAVRQARPIIANNFQAPHPLKKGYPDGHAPLYKYMTIPIFIDEHIVGVVGVANKQTDYDSSDVRQLTLLMDSTWKFAERKQAEEALRESERSLNRSQEIAHLGSWELDVVNNRLSWSDEVYRIFGLQPQEFAATYEAFLDAVHTDDRAAVDAAYSSSLLEGRSSYEIEHRIVRTTGEIRWVHEKCEHTSDETGRIIRSVGMVMDITDRKQAESQQQLASETLRILNRGTGSLHFLISEILSLIKESTGFNAVGLRIRNGEDCPYFEHSGFSDEFLYKENFLCKRQGDGSIVRDADGNVVLECTCGLVISGRTDPSMPFFTEAGSFWTNVSSELLAIPIEDDPRTDPRNNCIHDGYQSVALVPVRSGEEIIGLLQLNDQREGLFTPELIRFFEGLADNIGLALKRKQAEEELAQSRIEAEEKAAQLESFFTNMADGVMLFDTKPNFLMINEAALKIGKVPPGTSLEALPSQYELRTLDGEPVPKKDYPSSRALRGEHTQNARFKLVTPWAQSAVSISSSPVRDAHGQVIGGTLSFRDITKLVEFERYKEDIYNREHHIAQMLQQALIPPVIPTEIGNFRIGVRYQSALKEAEIGGDFYDVFDLGDGKVGVLIGDVTGKGLAAAIRVAEARYSLRSYAYIDPQPSKVLELTNKALCKDDEDESNILTAFFAVIDTSTCQITYTSAGHEPPVVCHASGHIEELLHGGIPLGISETATFTEGSIKLLPGDAVIMVTDGITEARTPGLVLFEKKGMIEHLMNDKSTSPDDIACELLDAATAHANGKLQDDAAIVVVKLNCEEQVSSRNY